MLYVFVKQKLNLNITLLNMHFLFEVLLSILKSLIFYLSGCLQSDLKHMFHLMFVYMT